MLFWMGIGLLAGFVIAGLLAMAAARPAVDDHMERLVAGGFLVLAAAVLWAAVLIVGGLGTLRGPARDAAWLGGLPAACLLFIGLAMFVGALRGRRSRRRELLDSKFTPPSIAPTIEPPAEESSSH
ncbi:MAG: hypothetical protein KY476_01565 [Planctomycetes bacterium]|nr:hypothetical protein [Planctomycetota bacterium]